jgi:metal-responsive CopG/Arc/MetJ family transcriptional regulator
MTMKNKPGPKPRPDSLTDAPVVSIKVPRPMLRGIDKKASLNGVTRAESIRDAIEKSIDEKAMDAALGTIHDVAVKALTGTKQEMHDALDKIVSVARYRRDVLSDREKS